ncbi:MAG: TIM barrel protein, partial [Gemmatimonadota bacterium]
TGCQWPLLRRSEPDWTGVDPALKALLEKALKTRPGERWADGGAMRRALQEWSATPATRRAVTPASRGLVDRVRAFLFGPPRERLSAKSVAVLPIRNLSRDEETEMVADGITEDIITHLSRIRDLKVISRTSVMRFKGSSDLTPREIGLERLRLFHLNDSVGDLASRRDRHAGIGEGEIGAEAFGTLLSDPRVRRIPGILETPKGDDPIESDRRNLERLREAIRDAGGA